MKYYLALLLLFICATGYAENKIPALGETPEILSAKEQARFNLERQALGVELRKFQDAGNAFNVKSAEQQTDEEYNALQAAQGAYIAAATAYNKRLLAATVARVIETMTVAVRRTRWGEEEKSRAEEALNGLYDDGTGATAAEVRKVWQEVRARRGDAVLSGEASRGRGPGLPGAGNQTRHQDCAIFALANAAGVPYGAAAARAAAFIEEGAWRPADERAHPQQAIEKYGVMGGEVILVAEAFGKVAIVPSWEFDSTLSAGRPVMVNLVPYDGSRSGGHQVVLTRSFPHDGATWFEMIDSNEAGPMQRLYLKEMELRMLLKERGITVTPEKDSTPTLLREGVKP